MNSNKSAYNTGKATGQAQEKGSHVIDQATNYAKSAQKSVEKAGLQAKVSTLEAVNTVKKATGINK